MSPVSLILLTILVVYFIYALSTFFRNYFICQKIPCPLSTKFFFGNILEFLLVPRGKMSVTFMKMVYPIRHHPLICIWTLFIPRIMITKAKAAEEILSSNTYLRKAAFYDMLHPWLGQGLLTSTGAKWRSHRKLLTPSFHYKILDNFLPIFNEQSSILVNKLQEEKVGKGIFNVYPYITLFALDVICETAMGTKIGAQKGYNSEYVNAISSFSEILLMRNIKVWLLNPVIFALSSYGRLQKKCIKILHKFTKQVIEDHRKEYERMGGSAFNGEDLVFGQKRRLAFLDTLLMASDNLTKLSLREIQEEVDTFMFEGHDTTSVAIGWVLHHLGWLPTVQDKVHEELDRIFGDSNRDVTLDDLKEMTFLGATIKESLRMTPSVPLYGRKLLQDTKIAGYTIPAGNDILINPAMIAADETIFKNPAKFDPSRFLNEEWLNHHPYSYLPFSAGPRNCIGQKFAIMEEKVVLANILRKFRIKSHVSVDLTELVPDVVLRPLKGFQIELIKYNNLH